MAQGDAWFLAYHSPRCSCSPWRFSGAAQLKTLQVSSGIKTLGSGSLQ
jgi:hypothetical protein